MLLEDSLILRICKESIIFGSSGFGPIKYLFNLFFNIFLRNLILGVDSGRKGMSMVVLEPFLFDLSLPKIVFPSLHMINYIETKKAYCIYFLTCQNLVTAEQLIRCFLIRPIIFDLKPIITEAIPPRVILFSANSNKTMNLGKLNF